ncbi:phytoene desaturase family protein [Streptomyces sp. NPDC102279]|uniref:phytoene desaturase family protein n=1 Tax=Streptomyces sp. NPDC102279 TaxID=3366153 RepID=UPI0037FF836F
MASPCDGTAVSYDAVIVGGGIGGLVCAGYLAVSGRRVLVAEQHDVTGGNTQVFRRRRAYEFDVGVHYLGDCGPDGILPAILGGLGARDRVTFEPMDPDGFDRIVLPGVRLDVPLGWDPYTRRAAAALPHHAEDITACLRDLRHVADAVRASMLGTPDARTPEQSGVVLRWAGRTLGELFTHHRLPPRAATLLAAQSGNYGSAPSGTPVTTHASMLDHYLRGACVPHGGGQTLAATLVEVIEAHGGEVRTRCPVTEIRVSDDLRCEGVVLAGGTTVHAPLVVSNADYSNTVLGLCRGRGFKDNVVRRTRAAIMRASVATVYVALDRPLDLPRANIWWWRGDDIEGAYAAALGGDGGEPPFAFLSFASLKDPGNRQICPPGHSNFQIMTLVPPLPGTDPRYRRRSDYMAEKARVGEALIRLAEEAVGPFRQHITHQETATAHTNQRYTLSPGGTPYGLHDWGGPGRRPDCRTAVDGLFTVGHNSRYGAGVLGAALSGITTVGRILDRPLLPEVYAGTVLGDPQLLAPRADDFDPLRVSRGLSRRDARGLARVG